ncbi:TerB N-terminal domain-containing protein [Arthrobacter sp. KNU40]|uniref:tellurite resistance TerB family protein n=1 Tax=Arthrobacter sp. KNU40 TaxID=3447965 RepID=UPI003F5F0609
MPSSVPASSDVIFEDQRGASVQALAPTSADDLVQQLNEAGGRKPLTRWVVLALVLLGLITMPFGLVVWLLGIPVVWWVVQRDRARRSVVIFYDVNDEHARQFQSLVDAGNSLAQSQKLWRINKAGSLQTGHQQKVNAGATSLVGRSVAGFTYAGPRELVTNIAVPGVSADGTSMYFLPDRILVANKRTFTDIGYDSLRVQERQTNFIESPGVTPSDAIQVGSTWQYVNKKGGPDRRFKNNPVLPIMKYTELELDSVNGFRWILQVSNAQAAALFARELRSSATFKQAAGLTPLAVAPPVSPLPEPPPSPRAFVPATQPPTQPAATQNTPAVARVSRKHARWYGANESLDLGQGVRITGMVYAGQGLTSPRGGVEPSLIDPTLRVDSRNPDWSGECLNYWPSYADITPAGRAAYLAWLIQGRRLPDTPIGYVFLFMYGLERRVLVDIAKQPELAPELAGIKAEMVALLEAYRHSSGSFSSYASRFIAVIDFIMLQATDDSPRPPALTESRWEVPLSLRAHLGAFAADETAIPADWALAWAWFHPEVAVRTAATRCTEEFTRLFRLRYHQRFGDGFTVRPGAAKVELSYTTASSQIGTVTMTIGEIPDVFAQRAPQKKLAALFDDVTAELDTYSRWLGRNPDKAGSLAAAALLPSDLLLEADGPVGDFRTWVQGKLERDRTEITGHALFEHWPPNNGEKLAKPEAVNLATLLDSFGAGLEPDVRFGGTAITTDTPVVLFRAQTGSPHSATPSYSTALTMTHLAAAVMAADGDISPAEVNHLTAHIESSLQLTEPERTRLHAHLQWLGASGVMLSGLTKRLSTLTSAQKAILGDMLVAVAVADGHIALGEVSTLQKIYKLLDLDAGLVTSRLHYAITGQNSSAAGPVTVRLAGNPDPGFPVPSPPSPGAQNATSTNNYTLSASTIQAKMAETAEVSALLGDIFSEDTSERTEPRANRPTLAEVNTPTSADEPEARPVGNLDASHSKLVRALAGREQLPWTDFEDLAAQYGLLPEGARDTVNEAALDASDEPLLEGNETLTINSYALQELLA